MELFTQTLALGVLVGGIYALLGVGLTLIFGVMRVANFAHGAFYMVGGYALYYLNAEAGLPTLLALVAAAIVTGALGYVVSSGLLWPVHRGQMDRPENYVLIVTFALTLFLGAAAIAIAGPDNHHVRGFWDTNLALGGWVKVSGDRIVAFVLAVLLIGGLLGLVRHTNIGRGWRALTQNRLGALVVGVDVPRLSHLAFATAGALAGAAGALLTPLFFVNPSVGSIALIKSFVIVIVGGLGSIGGALIAGLLLGVVEVGASTYFSSSYREAYGFVLLIVVLLLRPEGLFGRRVRAV